MSQWSKEWVLTYIPEPIPLLALVGFGGQPGYYETKWKHEQVSGSTVATRLLIRPAGETDRQRAAGLKNEYPHLTIDFNPITGAVAWFHYSIARKNQLYGGRELVKDLLPVLQAGFRDNLSTDDFLALLNSLQ